MSKRKMLFFHHCGTVGGAGISGINFLNSVSKEQYDITVCCVSNPDNMVNIFRANGYRVIEGGNCPASFAHCVGSARFALSPQAIRNYMTVHRNKAFVDRVIAEEQPDLVVANSMTLFWIGKVAKKHGVETLCFFRETYIHGLLGVRTNHIKKHLSEYFDKISFISNYELVRSKKIKSQKVTIYNMIRADGYDRYTQSEARDLLSLEKDRFYVLFVGGVSKLKGTLVLLRAMTKITDPNVKLLLVGSTYEQLQKASRPTGWKKRLKGIFVKDYSKKCLEVIEKNNLRDKIVFFPSQSDIAPFYRASNLLVFPMTAPHQARPLFEAGYAKIPVIITDFENVRDLVDERSGYLFKNKNHAQLAKMIEEIKDCYTETEEKVALNYQNTIERHSPEVYQKQIEELIEC